MKPKLVSIIIPTFNREKYIRDTLNSVLNQSYKEWECIIVDDGSTDRTLEILKAYGKNNGKFRYYERNRIPKGANTCRNIGIEHASGDYVIFLDSDDLLDKNCLENRIFHLSNDDTNLLITGTYQIINNQKIKKYFNTVFPQQTDFLAHFLQFDLPWHTTSGTWQKCFVCELNGFDEKLQRFQDPDLYIRALGNNHLNLKYQYQDADVYYRIGHLSDKRANQEWVNKLTNSYLYFYQKHFPIFRETIYKKDIIMGLSESLTVLIKQSKKISNKSLTNCHLYLDTLLSSNIINTRQEYLLKKLLALNSRIPHFKGNSKLNLFIISSILSSK
ncbi:glycosyltransferase family 2 protein [Membranihabitans maritimus]|uniref:glycosyltransferase family 2 protein n=1 Tax=Membranihabitans maritimus TaxID=2904244 RepID=UPI001F26DA35|nr:glycosyltransferase family 2 protein [Membranihabitans maritimus]